jgi:large subunit ribosomal protein L22
MAVVEKQREFRAEARFQRVSPQKARLVLDLIKGRGVEEALTTAAFTKKRIAPVIHKLLTSAVDNAKYLAGEQGLDLDVDNLYVKMALANDGPRMKRIRPAPMGRAFRYQRRLTHIVLSVAERQAAGGLVTKVEEPKTIDAPKPAAKAVTKSAKAKSGEVKPAAKKTAGTAKTEKATAGTAKATAGTAEATTKKAKAATGTAEAKAGKKAGKKA